jgi:hypothetical protein
LYVLPAAPPQESMGAESIQPGIPARRNRCRRIAVALDRPDDRHEEDDRAASRTKSATNAFQSMFTSEQADWLRTAP